MIMNTRDKEMTDQPRLKDFDLKSNSTSNINIIFIGNFFFLDYHELYLIDLY